MLVQKAGFSRAVAKVTAADLGYSITALNQSKWSRFHWCCGQNLSPWKASIQQIVEFFLYLHHDLKLSVLMVMIYRKALNHVFSLAGMDLASITVVCRMFCRFEKSCLLQEVQLHDWNLSLVFRYLSWPPFEPLKLASDKHLT